MKDLLFKFRCILLPIGIAFGLLCPSGTFAQTAIIPDTAFRAYLVRNYPQVMNASQRLILANADTLTRLVIDSCPTIKNIRGIEYFKNLKQLYASPTKMTDISTDGSQVMRLIGGLEEVPNLSANTQLELLDVSFNPMPALPDLSKLTALKIFRAISVGPNKFPDGIADSLYKTTLSVLPDMGHNTKLEEIDIRFNSIASLPDMVFFPNLKILSCSDNELVSLPSLSTNTNLEKLECGYNKLTSLPDLSNCPQLNWLWCQYNQLTTLNNTFANNPLLTNIDVSVNQLTSLPTINHLSRLTSFNCSYNPIGTLPSIPNKANFKQLYFYNCGLTSLPDFTGMNSLAQFMGEYNKLTFEDLLPLNSLFASNLMQIGNQEKVGVETTVGIALGGSYTINLGIDASITDNVYTWYRNGAFLSTTSGNSLTISNFSAGKEGKYTCKITNPRYPYYNHRSTDIAVLESYAVGIYETGTVPIRDSIFRQYLISNFSQAMNSRGNLVIAKAATVTGAMAIERLNVRDLTGIEYFTSLDNITLRYNPYLTSVPSLSAITAPKGANGAFLRGFAFQIEGCPVRELPAMPDNFSMLGLFYNDYITSIPVLPHPENLVLINTMDTKIAEYNIGLYPNLNVFNASYDSITPTFTFGYNPKLEGVNLHHNGLTSLPDLSSLPKLYNLIIGAGPTSIGVMNKLTFEDLILLKQQQPGLPVDTASPSQTSIKYFSYWPMDSIGTKQVFNIFRRDTAFINLGIDNSVTTNQYQWYKNGSPFLLTTVNSIAIPYDTAATTAVITCKVTNSAFPLLILYSRSTVVNFSTHVAEIPDANFRQCLLDSFPQVLDDQQRLIIEKAPSVYHLNCSNRNISNMSGVEYFTRLVSLNCSNNQLTTLPGLQGIQWQYDSTGFDLICYSNQLTSLPALPQNVTGISASGNKLSSLAGIEHPENIDIINISSNNFSTLPDLSVFPQLTYFASMNNGWASLPDLSSNTKLKTLYVNGNQLTSLPNLGALTELNRLWVYNNKLTFDDILSVQNVLLFASTLTGNASFEYAPQDSIGTTLKLNLDAAATYTIHLNTDTSLADNVYIWYRNGELVDTTHQNSYTVPAASAGAYTCQVTNPHLPGLTLYSRTTTINVSPWPVVIAGEKNHIIIIPYNVYSYVDGKKLEKGDYIGVFFNNTLTGGYVCGGYTTWDSLSTSITAYGNTGTTSPNGFAANEGFVFKIWKTKQGKDYQVIASYSTETPFVPGFYTENALSKVQVFFADDTTVCTPQSINLYKGWNLISLNVAPQDSSMKGLFAGISPVIVKNAAGTILYAPQNNIKNGTWNIKQGYQVYVAQNTVLSTCGTAIDVNTPISIPQQPYPYFLPYFKTTPQPVSSTLASIESKFQYVQSNEYNATANAIMAYNYIPSHIIAPAINQIGNMKPGLAYKVMATSAVSFSYGTGTNVRLSYVETDSVLIPQHFTNPVNTTGNNSILIIPAASLDGKASIGDEIGVFAPDGTLAGSAVFTGSSMAITVWENESMQAGESYDIKIWKNESQVTSSVDISFTKGDGTYTSNSLQVAGPIVKVTSVDDGNANLKSLVCYPNPANNYVNIAPGETGTYTLRFFNTLGEQVLVANESIQSATDIIKTDVTHLQPGLYTYQLSNGLKYKTGKITIVH